MSRFTTPVLILNLGCEMIFVVHQRLQAQNVAPDRASLVIDEIISVLTSKQLLNELMKPQTSSNYDAIRDILEDVTQSSAMRLDPVSMGKLWDLITMVFKWQVTVSTDVIQITIKHLKEIENYVTKSETLTQLQQTQNLVNNFKKLLTDTEKKELRGSILNFLKNSNVRVSLLLRMGLQNMNGVFITENLEPLAENMLKNVGENIYTTTQNGRILAKNDNGNKTEDVSELQLFVEQILGAKATQEHSRKHLRLAINKGIDNNNSGGTKVVFDNITVNTDSKTTEDIMEEFTGIDNTAQSLTEDLLLMIGDSTQ